MQKDTVEKLSPISIVLHWIIAIVMILLMGMGIYMENTETLELYPIHKSIGVIVALFIVFRVFWRLINGWPKALGDYPWYERFLAKFTHWFLIIITMMFPITGMVMSAMGGHGIAVFGLELVPMNIDPETQQVIPVDASAAKGSAKGHETLGDIFVFVIGLHILGALKHHFVDRDNTLGRIFGR